MPAAVRLGDICTGHGCFPPRPNVQGSPNKFVNNKPQHRQGDAWAAHGCADCPPHGSNLASGSPNVFVNGRQAGRIGDPVACGSSCATGSPDTFLN